MRGGIVVALASILVACVSSPPYVPSETMDVPTARQAFTHLVTVTRQNMASGNAFGLISDVRHRTDGVAFLYVVARDPGMHSSLRYDNPPSARVCYWKNVGYTAPTVAHEFGLGYVVHFCEYRVWFSAPQEAQQFANAIFVLQRNALR
jgi:hypothetical protein